MASLFRRLLYFLRRARYDAELREEIEAHRALRQAALEREGIAPGRAALESRRALGNVTLAVEESREAWTWGVADRAGQDVRAALRALRKSPAFTLVAVGTLALGIGANTALFSIFNSLILRPLPVRDPGRLALVAGGAWTYPIWEEVRRVETTLFDGAFAWSEARFDLSPGGETDFVDGAYASGRLFQVLGVPAARGRMLEPGDDGSAGGASVAVVSHRFWQQRLGGRADVVGHSIVIERVPFVIVGVMPPGFFGPDVGRGADLMIPFAAEPLIRGRESALAERSSWWLEIMVRLKPGQSVEQATAALRAVQPQIRAATLPDWSAPMIGRYLEEPFTLVSAASGKSDLRGRFEAPLTALVVAVGLVLLVACANIASLQLARALTRRRELSVRLALGASRWRLARLLFAESLVLAAAGAALGLAFAQWSSAVLVRQLNTWHGAVFLDLALDWHVLVFAAALAGVSALVAGVAPVAGVKSVAPGEALKDAGRGIAGDRRFAVRGTLVVAQIAVSLVLIVAAGLFLRTFASLVWTPLGFSPERLLVANLRLSALPAEARGPLLMRLRDAAAAVPGVTSAAVSRVTPVSGQGWNNWFGESAAPPANRGSMTWINAISPGWFATMGIPLRGGRDFGAGDAADGPGVAVVNESFARRFLPGQSPVGQTIVLGGGKSRYEVVGLVADAVYRNPREGMMPTLYVPLTQRDAWASAALTVATAPGQRAAVQRALAGALAEVDPSLAFTFRTFDELVDATVTQERLVAVLSAFFGGLALLLAAMGLYGIVAQSVRARRAEFGVRLALGARPAGIVRLVFRRVSVLVAAGVALGLACSLWAARFVQALLFQLEPRDPATFAGAAAALALVGVLAAWLPARRAARLDPASVLRES